MTKPGGLVVVFEHNPYNPLTRLVVRRCEFGEDASDAPRWREAGSLLGGRTVSRPIDRGFLLLFPTRRTPLASSRSSVPSAERPLGAQYYVAARPRVRGAAVYSPRSAPARRPRELSVVVLCYRAEDLARHVVEPLRGRPRTPGPPHRS